MQNLKRHAEFGDAAPSRVFVADSPPKGDGFEPSGPVAKKSVFVAEGELRGWKGAAHREVFLVTSVKLVEIRD
jgi:hypothetical protein